MSMKPRLSPCSRPRRMGVDSQPVGSGSAGSRLDQGLQERRPLLADPLPLFGFFSRLPVGSAAVEDVAAAFHLVPLVGWLSGGLGSLLVWVAWSFLPAEALAAVVLAFLVGLTGLNQTDGLLDLGDGLMVHGAADTRRQVMRDHVVGAGGVGLGLFTYLVSFACLTGVLLSLIHISEPTRRTPISYAVFCLKKKKKKKPTSKPHITYATETLTQNTNHTNRQ